MEWSDSETEEIKRWADELEKKARYWVWGRWIFLLIIIILGATITYEIMEIDKLRAYSVAHNFPGSNAALNAEVGNYIDARINSLRAEENLERAVLIQAVFVGVLFGILLVDWRRGSRYRLKAKLLRKIYKGS